LLTDIEGSTRAWQAAPEAMTAPVARHYEILEAAIAANGGQRPEEQGEGDSIVAVFRTAGRAVAAALAAQLALRRELPELSVRMALHSGDAMLRDEHNYVGLTIIRCARIRTCGHGGQILLSDDTIRAVEGGLPVGADVTDLGVYGLRDLAGRERIWQLTHPDLPAAFPPLKAGASSAGNLPTPISSFVGRLDELAQLSHVLAKHRLVSIVGAAGVGKSRLAIAAAGAAADSHAGGVWWVPLAELADHAEHEPAAVLLAVAKACSIDALGDMLDPVEALFTHFRSVADAIVVIDDHEQASGVVLALEQLLARCPSVRVLVTGRLPLGIAGEQVHALGPLRTPPDPFDGGRADLDAYDAARLFVERAAAAGANARFDDAEAPTIAHICRVLGGLPLGIELAAARAASTSLAQLVSSLGRLVGSPTAHPGTPSDTLTSSIAWSYQLLSVAEQAALRRLAVFAAGFEVDAAAAVVRGRDLDDRTTVIAIRGLVDQHLLTVDDRTGRLSLPPAIQRFAAERLTSSADLPAAVGRHGEWFAAVAERFAASGDVSGALPTTLLAPDEADVVAAMSTSMGSFDPSVAYRIIVAIGDRWPVLDRTAATGGIVDSIGNWLCQRSPSDGEEHWAAAVAHVSGASITRPDAPVHRLVEEATAVAELVHDDRSVELLVRATATLAATVGTSRKDMATTT
jgi:predicted ATPase